MKNFLVTLTMALAVGCNAPPPGNEKETPDASPTVVNSPATSDSVGNTDSKPQDSKNFPPPEQAPFELPQVPLTDRIADDFIPFFNEGQEVQSDVAIIRRDDATDLPFMRYLSLSFLDYLEFATRDAMVAHKMDIIDSMSIVLNHLSTEDVITKPVAINKTMSLFRIDIRDFGWNAAQWEAIVTGVNGNAYPYLNDFDETIAQLQRDLSTRVPIVRADWFLFEATKPASYHDLVRIPANLRDLEATFGVNRANNILTTLEQPANTPKAVRAALGPGQSGVSVNNRIIERHRANIGAYWISYDFAAQNNDPTKTIFTSPVGPANVTGSSQVDFGDTTFFNPDGGEVIYTMRNGLQGYMLVDAVGGRLDEAPTFVVFDPRANDNQGIIENGLSCMECHATGILPSTDLLRGFIAAADDEIFNDNVREVVSGMHPDAATMKAFYDGDSVIFQQAVEEALLVGKRNNVITQVVNYYDQNLTTAMLASELNITVDQFNRILPRLTFELRSELQPLATGGLEREAFETIFARLVEEVFNLQQHFRFSP